MTRPLEARSTAESGFTLLELLIVLFLLSLGYASLYSSGLGKAADVDHAAVTQQATLNAIRYARKLALAKGQPVALKIDPNELAIFNADTSTAVPSPTQKQQPYTVDTPSGYTLKTTPFVTVDGDTTSYIYFESNGRLATAASPNDPLRPLKTSVHVALLSDNTTMASAENSFLEISNVTGELMQQR